MHGHSTAPLRLTGLRVTVQSVLALSGCLALRYLNLSQNQLTSVAGLEGAVHVELTVAAEPRLTCDPFFASTTMS